MAILNSYTESSFLRGFPLLSAGNCLRCVLARFIGRAGTSRAWTRVIMTMIKFNFYFVGENKCRYKLITNYVTKRFALHGSDVKYTDGSQVTGGSLRVGGNKFQDLIQSKYLSPVVTRVLLVQQT